MPTQNRTQVTKVLGREILGSRVNPIEKNPRNPMSDKNWHTDDPQSKSSSDVLDP